MYRLKLGGLVVAKQDAVKQDLVCGAEVGKESDSDGRLGVLGVAEEVGSAGGCG
jgi:hypothetical protein